MAVCHCNLQVNNEESETVKTLLKATHANWGLVTGNDWRRTTFELYRNGDLHICVFFLHPVADPVVKMAPSDYSLICGNLDRIITEPPQTAHNACDGTAWSFEARDKAGKLSFIWKLGYIYGIEPLENIDRILNSYVPKYEKPHYSEDEMMQLLNLSTV